MKILALESSGLVAGAAVWEDGLLRAEYTTHYKKTHSQTLLPMLEEMCRMIELELESIDAIAVASGPGSFTGLRIGAATAKGLGFALDKPIVEVPTLEGLAYNLCGTDAWVCPLMDARRNQVYTGVYEFAEPWNAAGRASVPDAAEDSAAGGGGGPCAEDSTADRVPVLRIVEKQAAVDIAEILQKINAMGALSPGRKVIFLGDGAEVYRRTIREQVRIPYAFAPASSSHQRAAAIAALGAVYYRAGRTVSAADHKPEYLRKSQAEREREEHEGAEICPD